MCKYCRRNASPPKPKKVTQPFRFLDLPRELRDKVYRILLCSFEGGPPGFGPNQITTKDDPIGLIHPAILRTNKQIYNEAYDVMVRTNRFIHVKSFGGIPFVELLHSQIYCIVSDHRCVINEFKGFVMSVEVVPAGAWYELGDPRFMGKDMMIMDHSMILGEDTDGLVKILSEIHMPSLDKGLSVSIQLGPHIGEKRPTYERTLGTLFTEKTQERLLLPFRSKLRGFKEMAISGASDKLATAVKNEIAADEWTDDRQVLVDLTTAKERGRDLFKEKKLRDACLLWEKAVNDLERILLSTSWRGLVKRGGRPFITRIAELYFILGLNITQVQIIGMQRHGIDGYPPSYTFHHYMEGAMTGIDRAMRAMEDGLFQQGFTWEPSDPQAAKLYYRQAVCAKLAAQSSGQACSFLAAYEFIKQAQLRAPDDPTIKKEVGVISAHLGEMIDGMSDVPDEELDGIFDDDYDDEDESEEEDDGDDDGSDDNVEFSGSEDEWETEEEEYDEDDDEDEYDDMPELEEVPVGAIH